MGTITSVVARDIHLPNPNPCGPGITVRRGVAAATIDFAEQLVPFLGWTRRTYRFGGASSMGVVDVARHPPRQQQVEFHFECPPEPVTSFVEMDVGILGLDHQVGTLRWDFVASCGSGQGGDHLEEVPP